MRAEFWNASCPTCQHPFLETHEDQRTAVSDAILVRMLPVFEGRRAMFALVSLGIEYAPVCYMQADLNIKAKPREISLLATS
jgi:hypothetical protein